MNGYSLPCELVPNSLWVALYLRQPEYTPNDFHWALYLQTPTRGHKLHIKSVGDGWITEHGTVSRITNDIFLIGLIHVANVRPDRMDIVLRTIRAEDHVLSGIQNVSCRVWLLRALSRLSAQGDVRCGDVISLEAEIKGWGNQHQESALKNEQPRPLGESRVCQTH